MDYCEEKIYLRGLTNTKINEGALGLVLQCGQINLMTLAIKLI